MIESATVALLGLLVGGCVVTSSVEFEEEPNVPPVVLDTPEFRSSTIFEFDPRIAPELRIDVRLRDENLNDQLEVRARVSVQGNDPVRTIPVCADTRFVPPNGNAVRDRFELVLNASQITPRACNMLEVFVSSRFFGNCEDDDDRTFDLPLDRADIATATYWIWETSGGPRTNAAAAQALLNGCETKPQQPTITTVP